MKATIIADASYCPHTRAGGYGFYISSDRGKRPGGGEIKEPCESAGVAEMFAVVNAVHCAVQDQLVLKGDHIILQTDCQGAIDAFLNQRQRMTEGEKVARGKLYEIKKKVGFTFSFRHVKGHTGRDEARFVTNRLCDERARAGMKKARKRLSNA